MLIRYIGPKARKDDNVAETGLVWDAEHPVHDVANDKAKLLLKHSSVWVADGDDVEVASKAPAGMLETLKAEAEKEVTGGEQQGGDEQNPVQPSVDPLEAARAEAKELGLSVHHKAKLETILAAIAAKKAEA